jgi:hypothetical protein
MHSLQRTLAIALSIATLLIPSFASAQSQSYYEAEEQKTRNLLLGRWEGDRPDCLTKHFDIWSDSRYGELVVRGDGYVLGLPFETKWAVKTYLWADIPRVTLVLWIKKDQGYVQCMEAIDVTSKTLRFLNLSGSTYRKMQRSE